MPSLFVIKGQNQGHRFELDADVLSIGRDATNPIQLHDSEISRRHAEIRRTGDTLVILDSGSSNGTFVNSSRVDRHELESGDQVQVGRTLMLYTGPFAEVDGGLSEGIDIISPGPRSDDSRIVRTLREEEGSRLLAEGSLGDGAQVPWLARARSNLQVMYRTALAVSHTLDIDQLLIRIMDLIFEWVESDRGCIMLVDPDTKQLVPKVRRNRKGVNRQERITISKTILDYVHHHNEGVLTSNAREDERWDPDGSIVQTGIREAICVPMRGRYDVVGVIYVDTTISALDAMDPKRTEKFTEEHLKLMVAIGHQAALAVEDTNYYSAMVQAERLAAIGQTIAMLSHHIKNILQGISGGSYLIEEGLELHDEEVISKGWDIVDKNQKKISNLVMDMLTFSKDRKPELLPADLNQIVADVVQLMQVRADEHQVVMEFKQDERIPLLRFDPEGIHRAVLNIVTNAIDACDGVEQPHVEVETKYCPDLMLVQAMISDNGNGMADEEIAKMFAPFVSQKGGRGTGLGLPVSQKIIKEHGGEIHVESEPGKGSRFILEIPAIEIEPETATPDEST